MHTILDSHAFACPSGTVTSQSPQPTLQHLQPHCAGSTPVLLRLEVGMQAAAEGAEQPSTSGQVPQSPARPGLQFSDRDEHLYFWFPLLAGLSELTFEPQPDIRNGALGVRSPV